MFFPATSVLGMIEISVGLDVIYFGMIGGCGGELRVVSRRCDG